MFIPIIFLTVSLLQRLLVVTELLACVKTAVAMTITQTEQLVLLSGRSLQQEQGYAHHQLLHRQILKDQRAGSVFTVMAQRGERPGRGISRGGREEEVAPSTPRRADSLRPGRGSGWRRGAAAAAAPLSPPSSALPRPEESGAGLPLIRTAPTQPPRSPPGDTNKTLSTTLLQSKSVFTPPGNRR